MLAQGLAGGGGGFPMARLRARSCVHAYDYIPSQYHNSIKAGTLTVDDYDVTANIESMIAAIDAQAGGGAGYFPAGDYPIVSVDLTKASADSTRTLALCGDGRRATRFVVSDDDAIGLECTGRNFMTMAGFGIVNRSGVTPAAGILLGRHTGSQNCNNNLFSEINIEGVWSKAAMISIASESNRYFACRFENQIQSGFRRCFYTSNANDTDIDMDGLRYELQTNVNTDNRMYGCEFYNTQNGDGEITTFNYSASYLLSGCSWIVGTRTGTIKLAALKIHTGDTFTGALEFENCHFEGGGSGIIPIYFDCAGALRYFYNVSLNRGNMVLSSGANRLFDFDRDGAGKAYLGQFFMRSPRITNSCVGYCYGLRYSDVEAVSTNSHTMTILPTDISLISKVRANSYPSPLQQIQCHATRYADGTPTSGTVGIMDRIVNTTPAGSEPAELICSVGGTFGTLTSITASGTSGAFVAAFNSVTGLSVGDLITIAGMSGVRKVMGISGVTVQLTPALGATVSGAAVQFQAPTLLSPGNMS